MTIIQFKKSESKSTPTSLEIISVANQYKGILENITKDHYMNVSLPLISGNNVAMFNDIVNSIVEGLLQTEIINAMEHIRLADNMEYIEAHKEFLSITKHFISWVNNPETTKYALTFFAGDINVQIVMSYDSRGISICDLFTDTDTIFTLAVKTLNAVSDEPITLGA